MSQSESRFREMFEVLHNIDLADLETAGVIKPNAVGGSDWSRFNDDLTTFVLKLPAERVEALAKLVESRLARPWRQGNRPWFSGVGRPMRISTADRGGDETGWLAELQGEAVPQWAVLTEDYDEHWTTDAAKALRFARKADAEAFIAHHAWTRVVATEHMWPRIRPHEWAERFGLTCCLQCGNVKNDTSHLRSCKGVVNVGLRSTADHGGEVEVKALEWREPDADDIQDRDDCLWMATGMGGRYAISTRQLVSIQSPDKMGYLLWDADDAFSFTEHLTIEAAKAAAQADYTARIRASLVTDKGWRLR